MQRIQSASNPELTVRGALRSPKRQRALDSSDGFLNLIGLILALHRLDEGFKVVLVCLEEFHEGRDRAINVCDNIRIGS